MKATVQKIFSYGLLATAASLTACGGSDSGVPLNISGVGATGLAVADASVSVQCAAGTGTATTNISGAYIVTVMDGQGPCLVTLSRGSLTMLSIAPKTTNGTAIANITPFSDAIVRAVMQAKGVATPAALVTSAIPTNANLVAANRAALDKINAELISRGRAALPLTTDLLGQPNFVAKTTTNSGDSLDQVLDELVEASTNALPATLLAQIKTDVSKVVFPNPTGATGAGS